MYISSKLPGPQSKLETTRHYNLDHEVSVFTKKAKVENERRGNLSSLP